MNGFMGVRLGPAATAIGLLALLTTLALAPAASAEPVEPRIEWYGGYTSTDDGTVPVPWTTKAGEAGYRCAVSFDPSHPWENPPAPSYDDDSVACTNPWSFSVQEPGTRLVKVWPLDDHGVPGEPFAAAVDVYINPQVEIVGTPAGGTTTNDPHTNFSFPVTNPEQVGRTDTVCSVDEQPVPGLGPFAPAGHSVYFDRSDCFGSEASINSVELPDGEHTLKVWGWHWIGSGITAAASFGPEAIRTWTKDTHAPDTLLTGGLAERIEVAPGGHAAVTYSISGSDPAPGTEAEIHYQCRLDGEAWHACESTEERSLAVGTHEFSARAVDKAGNADPTPVTQRVKVVDRVACAAATQRAEGARAKVAAIRGRLAKARRAGHRQAAKRYRSALKKARHRARDAQAAADHAC
jgi:hypothetical protein